MDTFLVGKLLVEKFMRREDIRIIGRSERLEDRWQAGEDISALATNIHVYTSYNRMSFDQEGIVTS